MHKILNNHYIIFTDKTNILHIYNSIEIKSKQYLNSIKILKIMMKGPTT